MSDIKLIAGLGNPGADYHNTRHNVGFMVLDAIARKYHIQVKSRRSQAHIGEGVIADKKVVLAKPMTFMNLSGQAISGLMRRYRIKPNEILVIYDDVALPLGRLRIRPDGSAGGHNGMKSIIGSIGSQEFSRIRIGIGSPHGDMIDHVLNKFHKSELIVVNDAIIRAVDAVDMIMESGLEPAMNKFNPAPAQ